MPRVPGHVLVVEDDGDVRAAVAEILAAEGYPVEQAEHGEEALDMLARGPVPGAILLDLGMPVLDGRGTLERVRRNPAWARIPVIIASGEPLTGELAAERHVLKPYDLETLLEALEDVLGPLRA